MHHCVNRKKVEFEVLGFEVDRHRIKNLEPTLSKSIREFWNRSTFKPVKSQNKNPKVNPRTDQLFIFQYFFSLIAPSYTFFFWQSSRIPWLLVYVETLNLIIFYQSSKRFDFGPDQNRFYLRIDLKIVTKPFLHGNQVGQSPF